MSTRRADGHTVEFKRICFPPGRPMQSESTTDMDKVLDREQMDVTCGGFL
jgi:hypothetical protein